MEIRSSLPDSQVSVIAVYFECLVVRVDLGCFTNELMTM